MKDKKTDIFNCGKELFSSKGFKDTNVSDITKVAGMGVGTFYNYYDSKEKLFSHFVYYGMGTVMTNRAYGRYGKRALKAVWKETLRL